MTLQTVHTSGINWESVAVIVGSLVACLTFLGAIVERHNKQTRSEITDAVNHLGEVLGERLETKKNVAALSGRVAVLESQSRRRRWRLLPAAWCSSPRARARAGQLPVLWYLPVRGYLCR